VAELQKLLYKDEVIGDISRVFVDFGLEMPISKMDPSSRTADPKLGAGSLLDVGIYNLTWVAVTLAPHPKNDGTEPQVASAMSFYNGTDEMSSVILNYNALHVQAICTASMLYKTAEEFCRIEGSKGSISVGGKAGSRPDFLVVRENGKEEKRIDFEIQGWGFYWEADQVALDLAAGKKESSIIPLDETLRMMKLMDRIRADNGLIYPQDA
jgi:dihydrodiol dehydrogenase / D-xylose 1-dehydrogenase (NADP)